ncbi:MAG: carbohydrate porin [Candidatus Omnitrophica bacterium]|nr:carbohydrate porin [Candidatus Omnitrophota bacterium]
MSFRNLVVALVVSGLLLFPCSSGFAKDRSIEDRFAELTEVVEKQNERIITLEKRLAEQEETAVRQQETIDARKETIERLHGVAPAFQGLNINAGATFVGQGTPNANNAGAGGTDVSDHGSEDSRFDGSYSVDLEIEKQFGDYGMAFIHLEAGDGDTVEGDLNVFSNVNRDAGDSANSVDVTEAWYEHYLFDGQVTLTGGKIGADAFIDTNEYANDECAQFLGHMFRNSDVIDWPDDNNFGARMMLAPEMLRAFEVEAVYMEEDADWNNLFDEPFIGTQLNFMPARAFDYDEDLWGGNYRVYFWYNGAPHAKVKDANDFERGNWGCGVSCDQTLTEVFGVFGRFGWQDPEVSNLEYHWSVGGQMTGEYWDRGDDIVAIAVGQAIPGKEYGDAGNPHDNETHLEAYYAYKVNEHLTLSPDMQFIWNPNGVGNSADGDNDCIFVYGLRGQVNF